MNKAHPAIQAVAEAARADVVAVRPAVAHFFFPHSFVRSMAASSLAVLLAASAGSVRADPPRDDQRYSQRSERAAQQREDVRRFDPRAYEAREEQRRQSQMDNHPDRRNGRLSPDERRDLRRQINEAGMDIYPNAPRR